MTFPSLFSVFLSFISLCFSLTVKTEKMKQFQNKVLQNTYPRTCFGESCILCLEGQMGPKLTICIFCSFPWLFPYCRENNRSGHLGSGNGPIPRRSPFPSQIGPGNFSRFGYVDFSGILVPLSFSLSPMLLQPGFWHLTDLVVRESCLWESPWSRKKSSASPGETERICVPACSFQAASEQGLQQGRKHPQDSSYWSTQWLIRSNRFSACLDTVLINLGQNSELETSGLWWLHSIPYSEEMPLKIPLFCGLCPWSSLCWALWNIWACDQVFELNSSMACSSVERWVAASGEKGDVSFLCM